MGHRQQHWRRFWAFALWIWIGLIACGGWALAQTADSDAAAERFPVTLNGEVLFEITENVGSFSAEERAQAVTQRLQTIAADESIAPDDLDIKDLDGAIGIELNGKILLTLTPNDAQAAGSPLQTLALRYRELIRTGILAYRTARTPRLLLIGGAYALAATLALGLILFAMARIFPWFYRLIQRGRESYIPSLRIQQTELLPASRIADAILGVVKLGRTLLTITLLYLYATLVLSFFPWTKRAGFIMLGYILANLKQMWLGFISYVPNLLTILIIVVIAYYAIRLLRLIFLEIGRETITIPGFYPDWATPTFRLAFVLIIALALVVCLPYLPGFDSPAFQGVSLFLGVLFSLGSTAVVANIVAGVILIYTRSFQEGDRVQIAEVVGDILEKNLLVTRIVTPKNVAVTIPNAAVLGSNIINYSGASRDRRIPPLVVHTTITLGYDVPWRKVENVLLTAAAATPDLLTEPSPFVLQTSLDDFYVSYELNVHTASPNNIPRIYSNLHKNIQDGCNEADIEILSPHYSAVRDGHQITIPADYLPPDYEPPSFRVHPLSPWLNLPSNAPLPNKPEPEPPTGA